MTAADPWRCTCGAGRECKIVHAEDVAPHLVGWTVRQEGQGVRATSPDGVIVATIRHEVHVFGSRRKLEWTLRHNHLAGFDGLGDQNPFRGVARTLIGGLPSFHAGLLTQRAEAAVKREAQRKRDATFVADMLRDFGFGR